MAQIGRDKAFKNRSLLVWLVIIIMGVISALLVYSFLSANSKTVKVLMADKDIPQYAMITASSKYVKVVEIQKDTYETLTKGKKNVYTKLSDIEGFYTEVPIKSGELIYKDKVVDPINGRYVAQLYEKPDWKLITIKVSAINSGAAQLKAGDFIDIFYLNPDTKELVDSPNLKNIRIVDIKYGKNYFQPSTDSEDKKDSSTSDTTKTTDEKSNNINDILGDEAAIIINVPSYKANEIVDKILEKVDFYIAATRPVIFQGISDNAKNANNVIVNDFRLPSESAIENFGIGSSEETNTSGLETNNFNLIRISPEYRPSDKNSITSYEAPAENIKFQIDGSSVSLLEFVQEYNSNKNIYSIIFKYTDGKDKTKPRVKTLKSINLITQ